MLRTFAGAVFLTCVAAMSLGVAPARAIPLPSSKPNIVMFLMDDTNPMDNRLWDDPTLTPAIYNTFVAHGINFTHAYNDTPLCCPARATLLTGLHSFNTGVLVNNVSLFHPQESIANELDGQGYQTMLVGKYLNHPELLADDNLWDENAAPWSVFDIFTSTYDGEDGYFYNYTMTTKDGQVLHPTEHSTQLITERTIAHMAAADPAKPIFAELSIVDTHLPDLPMPGFENDPRWAQCQNAQPWDPPDYNEADVSDKPPYVQKTPLLPYPDGWPTVTLCEEMLGVDWMVQKVTDELQAEGRLDNTLLIFTTDNGMAWGEHRLSLKETPYATHLPLYMAWPARWGSTPRTTDEYTSNIDIAPTICDAAGCTLGPYPTGQTHPDGISLLPYLDGTVPNLGRDALLETEWRKHPWAAVRTTNLNPLGLWHYVEYQSGFRELYNLAPDADPWELSNLASDPAYNGLMATLHERLIELLAEGRVAGPGTVKIVQDTVPTSGRDFAFSGDFGTFALDDDSNATLPNSKIFTGVSAGTYTIKQGSSDGWSLSSITCPASSVIDVSARTAVINLQAGQNLVCTFHDTKPRPDADIAISPTDTYKGTHKYSSTPTKGQTQKIVAAVPGQIYDYLVRVKNRGLSPDSFTISATTSGAPSMSVVVLDSEDMNVTDEVMAGTYTTVALSQGQEADFTVQVTVAPGALVGDSNTFVLRATSVAAPTTSDVVRGITTD